MRCINCRYNNGCSGSSCYYEEKEKETMRKLEADPEANVKKYYTLYFGCAVDFNDGKMSMIEVHNHHKNYPEDDMREFCTKEELERYHYITSEYRGKNGFPYSIENRSEGVWMVKSNISGNSVYEGNSFEECFDWIEAREW